MKKEHCKKSQMGYISPFPGVFPTQLNSIKIDILVRVGDLGLINHTKFVMMVDAVQSYGASNFALTHRNGFVAYNTVVRLCYIVWYHCGFVLGIVTFEEFLRYVIIDFVRPTGNQMDEHWRPQYQLCSPCNVEYDFIGRFEHVNDDAKHVLAKLTASGGPESNVTFPTSNRSGGTVTSSQQWRNFYANVSHDIVRLVISIYKYDFELFGYDYHWVCNDC